MASKKNIKKDINYLTYEVVSDCYTFMYLHPDKSKGKAEKIIEDIIKTREELIARVNKIEVKDKKEIKQHFNKIYEDILNKTDESFTELSKLTK